MSADAKRFLESLYADAPHSTYALVFTLPDRLSRFFPADRLDGAASCTAQRSRTHDVFVGCGLRGQDHGQHGRGEAADVVGITSVWADLDIVKAGGTKRYFRSVAAINRFLDGLLILPTLRVRTGGGLHPWWLFREPWIFADAVEHRRAAVLVRGWQMYLRRRAAEYGAVLDATHDLARVLRVPGTVNHKYGVPVVLETVDGPRCNPSDLDDIIEDIAPGEDIARGPVSAVILSDVTLRLDPQATPPAMPFDALYGRDRRFAATWRRERPDLTDQSQSAFDLALATRALAAGWAEQDIVDLLIAHRRLGGGRPKLRLDYYARTLQRARPGLVADEGFLASRASRRCSDAPFESAIATALGLRP